MLAAVALLNACSKVPEKAEKAPSTQDLLKDLANSPNETVRAEAARKLAATHDAAAVPGLLKAINDESYVVQSEAALALRNAKDPAVPTALRAALGDRRRRTRFRVAAGTTLASLHDPGAGDLLVSLMPDAPDETAAALKDLGAPAIPALVKALRSVETRDRVFDILMSIGGGADSLIPLLSPGESKSTRLAAATLLAETGDARADAALNAASKTDLEVTAAAHRFFIRQGAPGTEEELIKALRTFGNMQMAADFEFSGNAELKRAADDWVKTRNMSTVVPVSGMAEVHWGGVDPGVNRLALFHFDGSPASVSGTAPAQSTNVSFVPGKWGMALSVDKGGVLKYPLKGNLNFEEGTIEMWVSPRFDGTDPVYKKYNHALLLYQTPAGDQFLVSEAVFGGFYAGSVVHQQYKGAGGGSIAAWKAGTWHHIAFTWSAKASRQRFYVDGAQVADNAGAMPAPDNSGGTFTVGCDPYGNWTGFVVDELQISIGEKAPDGIRSSATRQMPFADQP